jgi:hypothetical protein
LSWDDNPDLSGLKIGLDLVRAFVMSSTLTVLPLDFLNGGDGGNHNVSDPFGHFCNFFVLTALMIKFVQMVDRILFPYIL